MPREEGVPLAEPAVSPGAGIAAEQVQLWTAGARAEGEFRCSDCAYGVTVHNLLPACPMCASTSWEQSPSSTATRASVLFDL